MVRMSSSSCQIQMASGCLSFFRSQSSKADLALTPLRKPFAQKRESVTFPTNHNPVYHVPPLSFMRLPPLGWLKRLRSNVSVEKIILLKSRTNWDQLGSSHSTLCKTNQETATMICFNGKQNRERFVRKKIKPAGQVIQAFANARSRKKSGLPLQGV